MGWVTCHAETIIEPCERQQLAQHLRDFIDGCEAYGRKILLAKTPVDASLVPAISVTLPSLRVRNKVGGEHILAAPSSMEEIALRRRGRERLEHVRRNGFLQSRPINPLSPRRPPACETGGARGVYPPGGPPPPTPARPRARGSREGAVAASTALDRDRLRARDTSTSAHGFG
jgi:hypothetical protein